MQAAGRSRREENLIPLINVVFLLLIFFMLVGSPQQPESGDIELPRAELGAVASGQPPTLALDRNGNLYRGNVALTDSVRDDEIAQLGRSDLVRIRADSRTDALLLLKLVDQLRRAGAQEVELLNNRVIEKQGKGSAKS